MDIEKYVDLLMLDENTSKHIRRNMILAWNAALDEAAEKAKVEIGSFYDDAPQRTRIADSFEYGNQIITVNKSSITNLKK